MRPLRIPLIAVQALHARICEEQASGTLPLPTVFEKLDMAGFRKLLNAISGRCVRHSRRRARHDEANEPKPARVCAVEPGHMATGWFGDRDSAAAVRSIPYPVVFRRRNTALPDPWTTHGPSALCCALHRLLLTISHPDKNLHVRELACDVAAGAHFSFHEATLAATCCVGDLHLFLFPSGGCFSLLTPPCRVHLGSLQHLDRHAVAVAKPAVPGSTLARLWPQLRLDAASRCATWVESKTKPPSARIHAPSGCWTCVVCDCHPSCTARLCDGERLSRICCA
jgi:hypothetical protein